ncbi:MAG TPA: HEAT repeat domain-containing protein [Planctomycetota bacterium]|nr:HEAT repeat domain-containing protein [Planctomycetota bacterium]
MRRCLLLFLLVLGAARAEEEATCTCDVGPSDYESLGAPVRAPGDPSICDLVNRGLSPRPWRIPDGLDGDYRQANLESFLLRHAASWGIQCSVCARWKQKGDALRDAHAPAEQLAETQRKIGGKGFEAAISPHYAVVTDIPKLQIVTRGGGVRLAFKHEILHLYIQRAELARRDFEKVFGAPREMRSLMVLAYSESTRRTFSGKHWGHPDTNLLYGGGSVKLPGGTGNGFCISGRDDDNLHFTCRHMIGHLCISTYGPGGAFDKDLPQWIFRGAAHWLCKLHPRAKDFVTFCSYEGVTVGGSGSRWDDKAKKIASRGESEDPVERMFQASTAKQMNYDMHVRAWSWFEVFTAEEREPFVKFIQLLREAKEPRLAAKEAWGQAPEYVDDRWRERVMGKRGDVTATNREKRKDTDVEEAGARELRDIANESDPQLLAGKIKGLERCQNVKTARVLLSVLDARASDRVREVIALVLDKTESAEVLAWLRGEGYDKAGKLGRAAICRCLGNLKDKESAPLLRNALNDSFWLVQANAARALAQMGDAEGIAPIARLAAGSSNAKVRIAAMDALGLYGAPAGPTIPQWERNLMDAAWQVKVATTDAFRAIGDKAAVDSLIGRLDSEGGRVQDAIKRSLTALTGRDDDWTHEQWLKWWEHQKKFEDAERKMKEKLGEEGGRSEEPPEPKEPKPDERRTVAGQKKTGPPTYYGIKLYTRTVGWVIDISESMNQGFSVSKEWQEKLGRVYKGATRMEVCKEEVEQAIRELDPRTRINLVFFSDRVRIWQDVPQAAGTSGENAIGAVRAQQPNGQTNHYDALRMILGLGDAESIARMDFPDTPDTLFFLTDGTPTDGEITKPDELLSWFRERNRFARLRVHVIAMGNTGVDLDYLAALARQNDGEFLHLTGTH